MLAPLASEMDIQALRTTMTEYFISGGLISHSDGHSISPQEGNAALLSLENVQDSGLILTGLPLFPSEGGSLPGHSNLPESVRAVRIFPKTYGFQLTDWMLGSLMQWMTERNLQE